MNAIQTDQLTRSFGNLKAVNQLTLEIPRGTVFGFLGPNGSGKTTTIRLLLGLLDADQGSAQVLGFDTRKQPDEVRVRSGALLEHHGLYVLVSLRAGSVRQAQQAMSAGMLVLFLPFMLVQFIPRTWLEAVGSLLENVQPVQVAVWLALFLLAVELILIALARRLFQRSKLILD